MERCPICRATLNGAIICRRCQTDLGRLIAIEQQGQALAGEAMLRAATGDHAAARILIDRARIIQDAPDLCRLATLLRAPAHAPDKPEDIEPASQEQEQELEDQGRYSEAAQAAPDQPHSDLASFTLPLVGQPEL